MKIQDVLRETHPDVPPELYDRHSALHSAFKRQMTSLDNETIQEIGELFSGLDDDFFTGDVGFIEDALNEIESLLY